jgi:hypothetical protein
MSDTGNVFDFITAAGTLVTAVVAVAAFILAKKQLESGRALRDETDAQDSFRDYLRVAVEHPTLASGKPAPEDEAKYRWFVTYMLAALEKIQDALPGDAEWEKTIVEAISHHAPYLQDKGRFGRTEFATYDPKLQKLLATRFGVEP